jgi:hypothetical protein
MAEEDPERYIKRMRTYYDNEEQRTLWRSHHRDKPHRLRQIENKRHAAEKEYQRRKSAATAAENARKAAAAGGTAGASGGSTSDCGFVVAPMHTGGLTDLLAPLAYGVALAVIVFVVAMAYAWVRYGRRPD